MKTSLFVRLYLRARSAIASLWSLPAGRYAFGVERVVLPVFVRRGASELRGNSFLIDPERGIFVTCAHVLGCYPSLSAGAHIRIFADGAWRGIEGRRFVVYPKADVAFFRLARKTSHPPMSYAADLPRDGHRLHLMGFKGFRVSADPPVLHEVSLIATWVMWKRRSLFDRIHSFDSLFMCLPARVSDMQNFSGFSGSPIFSNKGKVFGMMQAQTETGLAVAMSVASIKVLLRKAQRFFDEATP